jgi:hypothetical protein
MAAPDGEFKDIRITADKTGHAGELNTDAREVAQLLGVMKFAEDLHTARQTQASGTPIPRRFLKEKVICLSQIELALEEVRKFVATINQDLATSNSSLDGLSDRKNQATALINNVNFTQAGILGDVKQGLRLDAAPYSATQSIGTTFFGNLALLGVSAVIVPSSFRTPVQECPTILTFVLDPNYTPPVSDQGYLWKYFNAPIPGAKNSLTRRQILMRHWEDWLELNPKDLKLINQLKAQHPESKKLFEKSFGLQRQILLLRDLRAHVEEFDNALYALHQSISDSGVEHAG